MVNVIPGCYVVTTVARRQVTSVHFVGKDRTCTCGGNRNNPCRHIREVEEHLRQGGPRAPEPGNNGKGKGTPGMACPICGAPVRLGNGDWRCDEGGYRHYWEWRLGGERGARIKAFFTDPNHPAKRGNAFYQMSVEERDTWLAGPRFPPGYNPYA